MTKIKIIVATHRKYRMPEDEMYLPIYVGAEGRVNAQGKNMDIGYTKDNTGDNISSLNPYYCELTGLYWAWKHLDVDYLGLAHYRRHFCLHRKWDRWESVLTREQIEPYLGKVKVFVPMKRHYVIESLYTHYANTMDGSHLKAARDAVEKLYPDYLHAFDKALNRRSGCMFNMMIMEKSYLDQYCTWLFDVLEELSLRVDVTNMSNYHKRYVGRVAERLFNVWLEKQREDGKLVNGEVKTLRYVMMERVNWFKKGRAFLTAFLFGRKYAGSF